MATGAPDFIEHGFASQVRTFDSRIVWNDATWNGQRGLEHGNRSQIGYSQLVGEAITIRVAIEPETFLRLHAVMVVEGVVAELPYGNHVSGLM